MAPSENISPLNQSEFETKSVQRSRTKRVIRVIFGMIVLAIALFFTYYYGMYRGRVLLYDETGTDTVSVDGWASPKDYAYWKDATFTLPQYDDIPTPFKRGIVKIFMDGGYLSKNSDDIYFFTKIKDRAPKVIAYGNFTGQAEREMAFILENFDYQSSAIFIIPQRGNVLYWKKLENELPTINSFKKGALIYMDKMELIPAPNDGIIKQTKSSKYVIIYNTKTKTFDEYYQYTNEDIKNAQGEDDETEDVIDTASMDG